ncbi:hypothetical protein F7Q92_21075, partial [Ideonella dechloratans]
MRVPLSAHLGIIPAITEGESHAQAGQRTGRARVRAGGTLAGPGGAGGGAGGAPGAGAVGPAGLGAGGRAWP